MRREMTEIKILELIEGAKQAQGLTVIIDVFRAFSVAAYAFGNGANRIIPVGDIALAYKIESGEPGVSVAG